MLGVNHPAVALTEGCMHPDLLANSMSKTAIKAGFARLQPNQLQKPQPDYCTAFLVLDAIELHSTVRDIIENKGSDASRSLREKADELEVLVSA
ncbi:hypothetical protein pdam_00016643 [Pocillopora damicornis]|uniref:Uncharacterized protein n=1 Tax=Pocillopora damicornis TaxID=46731 RepID=A0A3M6TG33_POCDA|nr:hypothetical protein pdam_00016643 [Pocillopora damicornis]